MVGGRRQVLLLFLLSRDGGLEMSSVILVVTQKFDPTADFLIDKLKMSGARIIRINTESFPQNTKLTLGLDRKVLIDDQEEIDLNEITSAWYRRPAKPEISSVISVEEAKNFAKDESWELLLSLWHEMNCFWVSKPHAIKNASHKWEQLKSAQNLGFNIPETLITNNPAEANKFLSKIGSIIIKTIYSPLIEIDGHYEIIYTTPITEFTEEQLEAINLTPCILQRNVPKRVELRITVVGNQVFTCAIESQASQKTKDDWRNYDIENTPHYPWDLPSEIERYCVGLVKGYGLTFGTIDMIVTPSYDYVFLEINPNGQWQWIEELSGLKISDALVSILLKGGI